MEKMYETPVSHFCVLYKQHMFGSSGRRSRPPSSGTSPSQGSLSGWDPQSSDSSGSSRRPGGGRYRIEDCIIPQVWCGSGAVPHPTARKRYTGSGSPHRCFQKGFGAGMYSERRKRAPPASLQHIPYVGAVYERAFAARGILTTDALKARVRRRSTDNTRRFLQGVYTKANGAPDRKAYNSTLLWLYDSGLHAIPACRRIA